MIPMKTRSKDDFCFVNIISTLEILANVYFGDITVAVVDTE